MDYDPNQINFKSENGMPLHAAISGTKPLETSLYLFSRCKDDIELDRLVNEADLSGVTPLFLAVYTGHDEVC